MVAEPSTLGIVIITAAFFITVVGAGLLILRTIRNPDAAIGARTRKRWEEREDARRLEQERRRLEEERRLDDEQRPDSDQRFDEEPGSDEGKDGTDE
ncbi:hypothetical protein [Brevibacterium yomogidense]|uniref:hypothetical protein n=1 Tax=Brevibacterium yomogidense TaxID=946573 RepID=UPI0018E04911|nr:hypothetical protein [Brevibacterium yomogidense]